MLRHLFAFSFLALLAFTAGCGQPPPIQPLATAQEGENPVCDESEDSALSQAEAEGTGQQPLDQESPDKLETWGARRDRALCYKLQPGAPIQGKKKSKSAGAVACCQPQSLVYARCRSGIATCKLGDTSPVQWFACAKKMGNTLSIPSSGSIMLLDVNVRRRMYTGHPVYIENAKKNSDGTWLLRISHTNYDRQCHLDQDAGAIFDPAKMVVSFQSGPWSCWARDLKVLGFILR